MVIPDMYILCMIAWRLVKRRCTNMNPSKERVSWREKNNVKVQKSWILLAVENRASSETLQTKKSAALTPLTSGRPWPLRFGCEFNSNSCHAVSVFLWQSFRDRVQESLNIKEPLIWVNFWSQPLHFCNRDKNIPSKKLSQAEIASLHGIEFKLYVSSIRIGQI